MAQRRTQLLALLLILGLVACALAYGRMDKRRADAATAAADLAACRRDLAALSAAGFSPARAAPLAGGDGGNGESADPELHRRIRQAATVAGVPDRLVGIEPGEPRQLPNSDYAETLVFLRLEALTLRQLLTFLHHLALADEAGGFRTSQVELALPGDGSPGGGDREAIGATAADATPNAASAAKGAEAGAEAWSADVTIAYTVYKPRGAGTR